MNKTIKHHVAKLHVATALLFAAGVCLVLSGCAATPAPAPAFAIKKHVEPTSKVRMAILRAAAAQVGKPYRSHATGSTAFSDNGLVQYAYARGGVSLPLAPYGLLGAGEPISMSQAEPADLVFYQSQLAGGSDSLRVGLYLNDSEMLYASAQRGKVIVQPIDGDYWTGRLLGVVQVLPRKPSQKQ